MVRRWHVYRWVCALGKIFVDLLNPPSDVLLIPFPKGYRNFHANIGRISHNPSTLLFPPLLLEIYQALDDWSNLKLDWKTRIFHWRNTGCKNGSASNLLVAVMWQKEQRTTILTLWPVSPGFPGAPGTPGKPLELTKGKSQLLLAIMIIQHTHTKSAR